MRITVLNHFENSFDRNPAVSELLEFRDNTIFSVLYSNFGTTNKFDNDQSVVMWESYKASVSNMVSLVARIRDDLTCIHFMDNESLNT